MTTFYNSGVEPRTIGCYAAVVRQREPGDLRLVDLETRSQRPPEKLMNAWIPVTTMDGVEAVIKALGCSKQMAVIVLLNEGLAAFQARRHEFPTPTTRRPRRGRKRAR